MSDDSDMQKWFMRVPQPSNSPTYDPVSCFKQLWAASKRLPIISIMMDPMIFGFRLDIVFIAGITVTIKEDSIRTLSGYLNMSDKDLAYTLFNKVSAAMEIPQS